MEKELLERDSQAGQLQSIFDNDPAVEYDGEWIMNNFSDNTVNPPKLETSHSTVKPGSSIFVSFSGVQILVSGTIPEGEGAISASYSIDNGHPITKVESAAAQDFLHQTLFQSPTLEEGTHNLTVTVAETGSGRNYTFQQFSVTKGGNVTEGNNLTQSSDSDGKNTGRSADAAAIVGGVLGTAIFLLLSFLVAFYFWRKKRLAEISNTSERRLPPMMYYARPVADGFQKQQTYNGDPVSEIDADSNATFAMRNDYLHGSSPSWVSVNLPPSVTQSGLVGNRDIPDWSTYKGSSVVLPQAQGDRSRFSPYTSTTLSPMAFKEPTPQFAPRTLTELPFKKGTLSSSSSLRASYKNSMF